MKAIIDWKTYECTLVEEPKKEWASNGLFIGEWEPYEFHRSLGIIWKTKEDADRYNRRILAYHNIRKRKTENDWDFVEDWTDTKQIKFLLYYDYRLESIDYDRTDIYKYSVIHFSSEGICNKAIKEIEEDILIYLWVK